MNEVIESELYFLLYLIFPHSVLALGLGLDLATCLSPSPPTRTLQRLYWPAVALVSSCTSTLTWGSMIWGSTFLTGEQKLFILVIMLFLQRRGRAWYSETKGRHDLIVEVKLGTHALLTRVLSRLRCTSVIFSAFILLLQSCSHPTGSPIFLFVCGQL